MAQELQRQAAAGELTDEQLDQVTGGFWWLLGGAAVMGAMYVWSWFQDESYQ
jgi:hypothetical protein